MRLDHIELERLLISPANMRAKRKPDLDNILPSVRIRGILVPLIVRPSDDEKFEIVAGRRRFLSAQIVAGEQGVFPPLPCAIMEAGDDAAALEASLLENIARLDPDEVTQWETFSRLVKEGKSVEDIAATFGITERLVGRILALGNLSPRIRSLYRQEKLDATTVRHLTMATKAQQTEWLKLYESEDGYAPMGMSLKQWLCGGDLIPTSAALFDLADYHGVIVCDLFGEEQFFAEPEAFWKLQRLAVEAKRQAYLEDGWAGVEILEPGCHFQRWEHEKRSKAKGGRVYLTLSWRGEVEAAEGWFPTREARREERGGSDSGAGAKTSRPEFTTALRNYLDLHRHAAVRVRLLERPDVALRLMIAHAIVGAATWRVHADPQHALKTEIGESVETCAAETLFDERRRAVLAHVGFDPETLSVVRGGGCDLSQMELFHRLMALPEAEFLDVAALVMGETLECGGATVDAVGSFLDVDMAELWTADEAFFELLRDKQLLTAIVGEVAGPEAANAHAGSTGKVMKGIVRDCLAGENGRTKVDGWVPRWLRFPQGSYRAIEAEAEVEIEPPELEAAQ